MCKGVKGLYSSYLRKHFYRVRDIWCYECNKYKGTCLGHIYPEPNEFKFIIKNKEEQNLAKIAELEASINELNKKITKLRN